MSSNPPLAVSDEVIKILFEARMKGITLTAGLAGGRWHVIGLPRRALWQHRELFRRIRRHKSEIIDVLRESELNNRILVPRASKSRAVIYDAQGKPIT